MNNHFYKLLPLGLALKIGERRIATNDRKQMRTVEETIKFLQAKWPTLRADCKKEPIFLFSTGWRSGSTLLQRLIMSDKRVMIWGEPYKHCNHVHDQMTSLRAIHKNYPQDEWFLRSDGMDKTKLADRFVANLYPKVEYLQMASRCFFEGLLEQPAIDNGYTMWGLKEVRLGVDAAIYLRWLFPNAKFVFLYRNPYDAYLSLKTHRMTWSLYETWPYHPVRSPRAYGKLWTKLISGFVDEGHKVNGLLIKYEDLCSGAYPVEAIANHLGISLSGEVLKRSIGGTRIKTPLTKKELSLLRKEVSPWAAKLGYVP